MKKLKISNPSNLPLIPYKKLIGFQGNLKEITTKNMEKMINSILKYGIIFPKAVWIHQHQYYIIDGHTTKIALEEIEKKGYEIPKIPYYRIEAKDKKEAKRLLLLINSAFSRISTDGLYEYIETNGLIFDELKTEMDFSEINLGSFQANFYDDIEIDEDKIRESSNTIICPKCGEIIKLNG